MQYYLLKIVNLFVINYDIILLKCKKRKDKKKKIKARGITFQINSSKLNQTGDIKKKHSIVFCVNIKSFIIEMAILLIKYVCVCVFAFLDRFQMRSILEKKERTCHQFKDQFRGNRKMRLM